MVWTKQGTLGLTHLTQTDADLRYLQLTGGTISGGMTFNGIMNTFAHTVDLQGQANVMGLMSVSGGGHIKLIGGRPIEFGNDWRMSESGNEFHFWSKALGGDVFHIRQNIGMRKINTFDFPSRVNLRVGAGGGTGVDGQLEVALGTEANPSLMSHHSTTTGFRWLALPEMSSNDQGMVMVIQHKDFLRFQYGSGIAAVYPTRLDVDLGTKALPWKSLTAKIWVAAEMQAYMRNPTTPMLRPLHTNTAFLGYSSQRWKAIYSQVALSVSDPSTKKKMRRVRKRKLDPVLATDVVEFQWNEQDTEDTELQYGFDASQLAALFPDSGFAKLHLDNEDPDFAGLHYIDAAQGLAVLWRSFQEYVERTDAKLAALEAP